MTTMVECKHETTKALMEEDQDDYPGIVLCSGCYVLLNKNDRTPAHAACQEYHTGKCEGNVEFRISLTSTPDYEGPNIPRCDLHWGKRLDREEHYREYDTPCPPDWFDPSYAGERWNEDD